MMIENRNGRSPAFALAATAALACAGPLRAEEAPAGSAPLAGGCASTLAVELDRESFSDGIDATVALGYRTSELVIEAANRLCRAKRIAPASLAPFRVLLMQNGEGADNAVVYVDEAASGPMTLIFQYKFGDTAPPSDDIEDALICWATPDDARCADRMP